MRFRFIRTGYNPLDEGASEFEIRECFLYCLPNVKTKLDRFIKGKEESVTFEFEGQRVTVRRETK
jgi:hypothetical protein